MDRKHKVFTKCRRCGKVWWTKAKRSPKPAKKCKKCGSTKTIGIDRKGV